jgi:hypothetical protein
MQTVESKGGNRNTNKKDRPNAVSVSAIWI